jgi:hypothetical protein
MRALSDHLPAPFRLALFLLLISGPVLALASCDLVPPSGGQRGIPTSTALVGRIIEEGDDNSTPLPGTTRVRKSPTLTPSETPTPTITPGTPLPTSTPTVTLTPFATPTNYPTMTPLHGPPTVTPRGEAPTDTPTATIFSTTEPVVTPTAGEPPTVQPTSPPPRPSQSPTFFIFPTVPVPSPRGG